MKGSIALAFILSVVSLTVPSLCAKGDTVKIRIKGAGLSIPIDITDPKIKAFNVWAGPGVTVNGVEQTEGFIVEWSKGVVAQLPTGLQHHEVSFYDGCETGDPNCRTGEPSLTYVVSYAYNRSTGQGFVYLLGTDDEQFQLNKAMWHGHGFEGNWLRATKAWEDFVNPLIAKAKPARPRT
jgi:hypothetical protein